VVEAAVSCSSPGEVVEAAVSCSSPGEVVEAAVSCSSPGEVIMIDRAAYGRMRLGRCVETDMGHVTRTQGSRDTADMGHVGCQSDVLVTADRRCSGRTSCEIRERSRPCLS